MVRVLLLWGVKLGRKWKTGFMFKSTGANDAVMRWTEFTNSASPTVAISLLCYLLLGGLFLASRNMSSNVVKV